VRRLSAVIRTPTINIRVRAGIFLAKRAANGAAMAPPIANPRIAGHNEIQRRLP